MTSGPTWQRSCLSPGRFPANSTSTLRRKWTPSPVCGRRMCTRTQTRTSTTLTAPSATNTPTITTTITTTMTNTTVVVVLLPPVALIVAVHYMYTTHTYKCNTPTGTFTTTASKVIGTVFVVASLHRRNFSPDLNASHANILTCVTSCLQAWRLQDEMKTTSGKYSRDKKKNSQERTLIGDPDALGDLLIWKISDVAKLCCH